MKLLSFITKNNNKSYGIYNGAGIIDLGARLSWKFPNLKAVLEADGGLQEAALYATEAVDFDLDSIQFLPVIERPNKILCVGMNYAEKRAEFGETNSAPTLFVRFPDSQTGHKSTVLKPAFTNEFDYEGELAIIIGKSGLNIPEAEALNYIAGYSCYMDGSVRDWQHSWFTAGKNWEKTGSFGPWMVTSEEIADPGNLQLQTFLNGQKMQDDNTINLIHSVPELIAYISTFTKLSPGDVIITGSPGGVGKKRNPPIFMNEGDLIEIEIEKIGRLQNRVVAAYVEAANVHQSPLADVI